MDDLSFSISMSLSLPLSRGESGIRRYSFTILAEECSGTTDAFEIGKAEAVYLPIAWLSPEGRFDLMDECSDNVMRLERLLFKDQKLTTAAVDAMHLDDAEEGTGSDLIFLEWLKIDPAYRGRGLGLGALGLIIQMIAPNRTDVIVAGIAGAMDAKNLTAIAIRTAQSKLRRHWRKLGFKRLGKSGYIALHTSRKHPDALELVESEFSVS